MEKEMKMDCDSHSELNRVVTCYNSSCDNNNVDNTCMFRITSELLDYVYSNKPICKILKQKVMEETKMAKRTTIKNEEKIQEMAEKKVIVEDQVVTDTFPSEVTEEKVVSENTETEET